MYNQITQTAATIDYIEQHLDEKLNLDIVAAGVCYSKYHVHRVFRQTVGMSIHTYMKRRQLTEAAKLLVQTDIPILDIALQSGYESQQAFSSIFTAMYKKSPKTFRCSNRFYALQLPYELYEFPQINDVDINWERDITQATIHTLPCWISFISMVIDGFPCFEEPCCIANLKTAIANDQALVMKDGDQIIGAMIFERETGNIPFLGIHPQFKRKGIIEAFLKKAANEIPFAKTLQVTTYRAGDKADTGYRSLFKQLGFEASSLLIEYGYPTQLFTIPKAYIYR
ncbi:MAG: helix-turn-helix domain-containing protein [Sphaerochaetaceae bacterium]